MRKRLRLTFGALAVTLAAMAAGAAAQPFPQRPLRLVVPYPPGGSTDVTARLLAQELGARLGQPVVTENRPGAGTIIGTDIVARAAPDGHTLLFASTATVATPSLNRNWRFDPRRDLAAVSMMVELPLIIVANPQAPFRTLPEMIAHARANPGALNMAYPGLGTTNHLAAELFRRSAGVDLTLVQFPGNAPAITALLRYDVHLALDAISSSKPHLQDGSLRALAVTSRGRSSALPEVPSVAEAGVPDFEATGWFGPMATAGTPPPAIERLAAEVQAIVREPQVIARLRELGFEPVAEGAQHLTARVAADVEKWGKLIREARIAVE